jgi:hypothetical protein
MLRALPYYDSGILTGKHFELVHFILFGLCILIALSLSFSVVISYAQILSAAAVTIGAIFVLFQLRQNNKLIEATSKQAEAAVLQEKLANDQMTQTNQIANMDIVMRLYEFANTAEFQSAWITVLHSNLEKEGDWEKLSKQEQVSVYQVAALFESLGVLVQRNIVQLDVIDDTFQVELAWEKLHFFTQNMRRIFGEEAAYTAFEGLNKKLKDLRGAAA